MGQEKESGDLSLHLDLAVGQVIENALNICFLTYKRGRCFLIYLLGLSGSSYGVHEGIK